MLVGLAEVRGLETTLGADMSGLKGEGGREGGGGEGERERERERERMKE